MPSRSLFEHNPMVYKGKLGFDYPEFYEIYEKTTLSTWTHLEVSMDADLRDWQYNSTEDERRVIAGVQRGFIASELGIGCYWANDVCRMFAKPEIHAMARAFSYFECTHAAAYSHLNNVLGLNEYEEFIQDPVAVKKIETFFKTYPDKVKLAVFSGAGEGVSLFSSFAILLSFSRDGRFKGLAQIISWSASDEDLHSNSGIMLFNEMVKEVGITQEEQNQIYEGFRLIVDNEFKFIDNIDVNIPSLSSESLKSYILYRANKQLKALNLEPIFEMSLEQVKLASELAEWFEPMAFGVSSNDFFAQSKDGSNYISKVSQDFEAFDIKTLSLEEFTKYV
jgi:ribonucleoside-diphosphate reductase beta chain